MTLDNEDNVEFLNEDNLENRFREFCVYFVSIFKDDLLNYNEEAVGQKEKMGKWATFLQCVMKVCLQGVGGCIGCFSLGFPGVMGGSKGGYCAGTIANYLINPCLIKPHKEKAKKISKLVGYYNYGNKSSVNVLNDVLIDVAVKIFASFEWQFIHIPADCDWKHAIHKLAKDAIARTMNYMDSEDITSVENLSELLIEGVLHGNSKESYLSKITPSPLEGLRVGKILTAHPGRTIQSADCKIVSCNFWTKPGVIDNGKFYYSDKCNVLKFGYRHIFACDSIEDFTMEEQDYIASSFEYRIKNDISKYKKYILHEIETLEETMVSDIRKVFEKEMKSIVASLQPSPTLDEHCFGRFWPQKICLVNSFVIRFHELGLPIVDHINDKLKDTGELVITGCVGVGKTSLARWFSDKYENLFDNIFWIDCGNIDSLRSCVIDLAASIGVTDIDNKSLPVIASEIYNKFQGRHCLFVFDGAVDYVTLKSILPSRGVSNKINCLVTSRHEIWGQHSDFGSMESYKLSSFSDREAMECLTSKHAFGISSPTSDVQELARILHNHPLALRQTVAFIKNLQTMDPSYDIHKCLKEFKSKPEVLLQSRNLDDYCPSIYEAFMETCDEIQRNPNYGKLALTILSIIAYFDCEAAIDYELFYSLKDHSEAEVLNALDLLKKYLIITPVKRKTRFIVFDLFQLVMRIKNQNHEMKCLHMALSCLDNSPISMIHFKKVWGYAKVYPSLLDEFKHLHDNSEQMPFNVLEYSSFNLNNVVPPLFSVATELKCIAHSEDKPDQNNVISSIL